jgi:hypothetical protein
MNIFFQKIARIFFVGLFIVSSISLLAWEIYNLNSLTGSKNVLTFSVFDGPEKDKGMILGEANSREIEEVVISDEIKSEDARPLIIKRYLEKYKSPLAPYANLIFELSQDYGFEYYWIVAIAQQESNLCKKIPEDSHNCWGYGVHSKGTLKFENYEIALRSYAEYLKREYFDKGMNTSELIMKKYCPSSNGSWAYGVNQFIKEMEMGSY